MTKKNILLFSVFSGLLAYIFDNPTLFKFCVNSYTFGDYEGCFDKFPELMSLIFVNFFLLLFFPVLLTYKMRDEVFQAWWRFARWFVPVIVIVTFLQNGMHQQSGFGGVAQGAFDFLVLVILYTVFIAFSLAKIIGTSIKLRKTS